MQTAEKLTLTAAEAFPHLGSIQFTSLKAGKATWNPPFIMSNPIDHSAIVTFTGQKKKVIMGVVFNEHLHEVYGLAVAELTAMQKLKTPHEQRDFCDKSGKLMMSDPFSMPIALVEGHEPHPQDITPMPQLMSAGSEEQSPELIAYLNQRSAITTEMEEFVRPLGFSISGEPENEFVNLTHQTRNEFHTNTQLRQAFPADISPENPLGLDFDAVHKRLVNAKEQEQGIASFGGDIPSKVESIFLPPDTIKADPKAPDTPGSLEIRELTEYSKINFKVSEGQGLFVTVPSLTRLIVFDKQTKKGLIRTERFKGHFELTRNKYKKNTAKSTGIGFNIALSLLNAGGHTVNNNMTAGDMGFTTPEYKEKLEKKSGDGKTPDKATEPDKTPKSDKKPDDKTKEAALANLFGGATPSARSGMISVALGAQFMSQKMKAYESDRLRFLTDSTFHSASKDKLDLS